MVGFPEHVVITETEHGTALLDERSGRYWITNGSAAVILRSIREHGSAERAASDLCAAHPGLPGEDSERDVTSLLARMRQDGLLT